MSPTAIKVQPMLDYCLCVTFDNGETRKFDVKPYLHLPVFRELNDLSLFRSVHPAGLSIEWAGGQDICPDELYHNSKPIN